MIERRGAYGIRILIFLTIHETFFSSSFHAVLGFLLGVDVEVIGQGLY